MRLPMLRILSAVLAIAASALAPLPTQAAEKIDKLITVTGEATVAAAPDAAQIRIGVSSRDIQTTSLSLQPQYDPNKTGGARLIGFQANNQVTIKVRDIGQLPNILDRAISAGANEMSGIEFVVSEQSKLLDKARAEAIADARRKAELYANAAGMKVGRVMTISEEGTVPPPRTFQAVRAGAAAIAPGEQTLRAVVTVSYELTSEPPEILNKGASKGPVPCPAGKAFASR